MVGKSTASTIVHDTCLVLWEMLKDLVMRKPTKVIWSNIAQVFWNRCNFPNCVGAIDGKHIRIVMPVATGSRYGPPLQYVFVGDEAFSLGEHLEAILQSKPECGEAAI